MSWGELNDCKDPDVQKAENLQTVSTGESRIDSLNKKELKVLFKL